MNIAVEYTRVFRTGYRVTGPFFTVLASSNKMQLARLGLAISRKAAPLAVQRNRIKRQIRESFRQAEAGSLPPLDIVVMAKQAACRQTNAELRKALAGHWQQLVKRCEVQ